ncbi:MAG: cysteine desulfurase family protein, partial [Clostridia bacterium]
DSLSMSAHKFYGPKGIGALYVKRGIKFQKLINGGYQEKNKRAGTENVPAIVGMGKAIELAYQDLEEHTRKIEKLRDYYVEEVRKRIPYIKINGDLEKRLPGNSNISFRFIEGESMLLNLDLKGICASSGSACTSGSLDPSHVLLAIGLPHEIAHGSLRISIGKYNTKEEVDYLLDNLTKIVERLRNMSPLYEEFLKGEKKNNGAI